MGYKDPADISGRIPQPKLPAAWRRSMIARLLSSQRPDGGFGVHPYRKWTGSHWRLVSLVELGVPKTSGPARAAADNVLAWIAAPSDPMMIDGRERRHASMEGNALAICCRLGMAHEARVRHLVDVLLRSQWGDGGWNCDREPSERRSSFHETLAPIWGLVEYHRATGDRDSFEAAQRAVELLLQHRLFRSRKSGKVIDSEWLHIHWPHYWHYDFLQGLRAVGLVGLLGDPRAEESLELLRSRRRPDGTWKVSGRKYWSRGKSSTEVVDWGDAQQIVTAAAQVVLQ